VKTRVVIGQQVHDFITALAPQPRRELWSGIKALPEGKGDVLQLQGPLSPYFRLRVKKMRVIFEEKAIGGERVLICFYADYRSTVHVALAHLIAENLLAELKG